MKKRKVVTSVLLMFTLVIGLLGSGSVPVQAAKSERMNYANSKNAEAKAAFRDILDGDTIQWGNSHYDASKVTFCYRTLGSNEVPILIVNCNEACHAESEYRVFQYVNGKVKTVIGYDDTVHLYKKSGVFATSHSGGGYGEIWTYFYKLNKNGVLKECAETGILSKKYWGEDYASRREMFGPDQYKIGSKSVTKKTFQSYLKKIRNGSKDTAKKIVMRKNTSSNRTKYL